MSPVFGTLRGMPIHEKVDLNLNKVLLLLLSLLLLMFGVYVSNDHTGHPEGIGASNNSVIATTFLTPKTLGMHSTWKRENVWLCCPYLLNALSRLLSMLAKLYLVYKWERKRCQKDKKSFSPPQLHTQAFF